MKFTPEEINLCKQVVKRHKKDLFYGDWFLQYDDFGTKIFDISHGESMKSIEEHGLVPLWTISDCLEFLRKKVNQVDIGQIKDEMPDCYIYDGLRGIEGTYNGKTPLEACLKAVLAVLEEE